MISVRGCAAKKTGSRKLKRNRRDSWEKKGDQEGKDKFSGSLEGLWGKEEDGK